MRSNQRLHVIEECRVLLDFVNHDPLISRQRFDLGAEFVGPTYESQEFGCAGEIKLFAMGKFC